MKNRFIYLLLSSALLLASSLNAVPTGSKAPGFSLLDTSGESHSLVDFKGKYVVLEWINHGCPFVKKHYQSGNIPKLQKKWTGEGVVWLSVQTTHEGHPQYQSAAKLLESNAAYGAAPTAVLMDPTGAVGKAYDAKTTPHIFIIDPDGQLIYQGAIDSIASTTASDIADAANYVEATLNAAMAGNPVTPDTTRAYGCSVKYAK